MRYQYELAALTFAGPVTWSTRSPQTAHRWFRQTVRNARTIDTDAPVFLASLRRDGCAIKAAIVLGEERPMKLITGEATRAIMGVSRARP